MKKTALRTLVLGALASIVCAPTTFAETQAHPSPMTEAFLANVRPNVDFLERSSRLATEHAGDVAVRAYARSEASDAVRSASLLKGAAPRGSTAVASADSAVLMTGRSVAVDGPTGGLGQSANGRQPLGDADVATLTKLGGRQFNDAFWIAQVATGAKAFSSNPVLGSRRLNALGLHAARQDVAHRLAALRRRRLARLVSPEHAAAFERDGFVATV